MKCIRIASFTLLVCLSSMPSAVCKAAPDGPKTAAEKRISPQEADKLFRSVDTILKFDSQDTGLPIRNSVKRKLTSRDAVEKYLAEKMDEDKGTAKVEQSAMVLEKFGLLPEQFDLKDFLLKLLREQVAGYYDSKTKTVYLLDWIDADTQQPVLAHELTHALQDQYQGSHGIALDKWEDPSPEGNARNFAEDQKHVRTDERGTAREAVLEGQAMVSYLDWGLNGRGQTLRTLPLLTYQQMQSVDDTKDSPILSSAPPVLRESLLFPYQEGLIFEQWLLQKRGTSGAFADVLNRPPDSSWEILHPLEYAEAKHVPLLAMPNLHPLLDNDWAPYDVGVMGALDVRMLAEALKDKGAGADAAADWDGGVYYAAQSRKATDAKAKADTGSLALMYVSRWKSDGAAEKFAALYADSLAKRYPGSRPDDAHTAGERKVFDTSEGPVVVDRNGRYVFVSHTLPVETALAVEKASLDAQIPDNAAKVAMYRADGELLAPMRRWFAEQGVMRAAGTEQNALATRVY